VNIAVFATCLVDQLYPDVGVSVVRLLRRYGCAVSYPRSQTCCGQPAFNSGYVGETRRIARNHIHAFAGADYIVTPSGSCAGMVRHYYPELFDDPAEAAEARRVAERTHEFSQFLVDILGVTDVGAECHHRVTFHPGCHGTRLLGVRDQPLRLLEKVRGIDLVPLPCAQDCCGFGGTFAVKLPGISGAMVAEKVDHVVESGAEYVVSGDLGCLMNIGGHMKKRGVAVTPMHIAAFLDRFSKPGS
jgi:L-lactate dehydrogenase complex protein LldE